VRQDCTRAEVAEREFSIDNLLVRSHLTIVMIRWTGLAPCNFEFPFPGSLTSTFIGRVCTRPSTEQRERWVIYCRTTSVSVARATHCASYCTPCRPLIRAFSGWIRTPPPKLSSDWSSFPSDIRGGLRLEGTPVTPPPRQHQVQPSRTPQGPPPQTPHSVTAGPD
jgi:hypothetical protein